MRLEIGKRGRATMEMGKEEARRKKRMRGRKMIDTLLRDPIPTPTDPLGA